MWNRQSSVGSINVNSEAKFSTLTNTVCTICRLAHPELLDAAHIIPDSHERGVPAVTNGLSMCKIHHSAYDANFLGIDPNYRVHINQDLLEERDGPMLKHGLQEMHGSLLVVPRVARFRPDREAIEERYALFGSAN
jgi:putative restriction endonuclease